MDSMEKTELIMDINDAMKRAAVDSVTALLRAHGVIRSIAMEKAEEIVDACDFCDSESMAEKIEEFLGEISA